MIVLCSVWGLADAELSQNVANRLIAIVLNVLSVRETVVRLALRVNVFIVISSSSCFLLMGFFE